MNQEPEILTPCPFCGQDDLYAYMRCENEVTGDRLTARCCPICMARTDFYPSEDEADAAWDAGKVTKYE